MINFKTLYKKKSPTDKIIYIIPEKAIEYTEKVLCEYGNMSDPNEGLVYWGGHVDKTTITISAVIAPKVESAPGRVSTSHRSNFDFVTTLNEKKIIQIAQVHSHPGDWVDHSEGDSKWAAFKSEGLISIVVPNYCKHGMLPLIKCGIHRFRKEKFTRLLDRDIKTHFRIDKRDSDFIDLRR